MCIYRCKLYYEDRNWKVANHNQLIVKPSHNIPKILGGGHAPCSYTYVWETTNGSMESFRKNKISITSYGNCWTDIEVQIHVWLCESLLLSLSSNFSWSLWSPTQCLGESSWHLSYYYKNSQSLALHSNVTW